MRSYLQYFRKRSVELPIWLGIPFIGVFLTVEQPPIGRLILFAVAATLAISHLLLVNDWGGLKRTPLEMNRYQDVEDTGAFSRMLRNTAVLTLPIAVLVGFFLLPPELLLGLGVSGILLSVLYSHPSIHLKEDPILSNVLHLLGGTLLFVLGVAVFAGDVAKGITIGLFFGMILMGGHFIHECIDSRRRQQAPDTHLRNHVGYFSCCQAWNSDVLRRAPLSIVSRLSWHHGMVGNGAVLSPRCGSHILLSHCHWRGHPRHSDQAVGLQEAVSSLLRPRVFLDT